MNICEETPKLKQNSRSRLKKEVGSSFLLYPNPATRGVVNIETATQGDKQVIVMDVLGKTVMNTTISGTELNISSLKDGVYMVQVIQNDATATRKLIVN